MQTGIIWQTKQPPALAGSCLMIKISAHKTLNINMTFAQQGFAIIDDLLAATELVLARELVAGLIARYRSGDQAVIAESISLASITDRHPQRNPGIVSKQVAREPYIIGNLISLDSRFARIFAAELLWYWASRLLSCSQEAVVFHFSNITRKPSLTGPAISWHRDRDNTYFASSDYRMLRFLLPMQPMSQINGGTEIIAGSHLSDITWTDVEKSEICYPTVNPGSCLVLHAGVLHGGSPNRSTTERDVIVLQFGVATSALRYQADEALSLFDRETFIHFSKNNLQMDTHIR